MRALRKGNLTRASVEGQTLVKLVEQVIQGLACKPKIPALGLDIEAQGDGSLITEPLDAGKHAAFGGRGRTISSFDPLQQSVTLLLPFENVLHAFQLLTDEAIPDLDEGDLI